MKISVQACLIAALASMVAPSFGLAAAPAQSASDWVRQCDEAAGSPWDLDAPSELKTEARMRLGGFSFIKDINTEESLAKCLNADELSRDSPLINRRIKVNLARIYAKKADEENLRKQLSSALILQSYEAAYLHDMLKLSRDGISAETTDSFLYMASNVNHIPSMFQIGYIYWKESDKLLANLNTKLRDATQLQAELHAIYDKKDKAYYWLYKASEKNYPDAKILLSRFFNNYDEQIKDRQKIVADLDGQIDRKQQRSLRQGQEQQFEFERSLAVSNAQMAAGVQAHNDKVDAANASSRERARAVEAQQRRTADAYAAANRTQSMSGSEKDTSETRAAAFEPAPLRNWAPMAAVMMNGRPTISIAVRDHECVDGDVLQVSLNGAVVMTSKLSSSWDERILPVVSGPNTIDILAVNGSGREGKCDFSDVNTGEIRVSGRGSGGALASDVQRWKLRGGAGSTSTVRITVP